MKITIQSIHFDADAKLLAFIEHKLSRLTTYFDRISDADVYLKLEKDSAQDNKVVEIKLHVPGEVLIAKEKATTFEESTDLCLDKVKAQVKKFKEKIRTH